MEQYRKLLKRRIYLFTALIFLSVFLLMGSILGLFETNGGGDFVGGLLEGFQSGLITGLMAIFVFFIVRYAAVLRDDKKLKEQYNRENDERRKTIKEKSGGNAMLASTIIILFAGIISGYFNQTVFFTLTGCGIFQLVLSSVLKAYYTIKY